MSASALLSVTDLKVSMAPSLGQLIEVTHGVSFDIDAGGSLGIVGESGSGKSISSLALMGLLPRSSRVHGVALFEGQDVLSSSAARRRAMRGNEMSMIFQDPLSSLHPYYTVGNQLVEAYRAHHTVTAKEGRELASHFMERVGIRDVSTTIDQYPHQFSGGMRQRIMIAMALICRPKLIIADEPTTALDVTVQATVIDLIKELQEEMNTALIFITHDLALVSSIVDNVMVMRNGDVVEQGPARQTFEAPRSDYTKKLLRATPRIDSEFVSTGVMAEGHRFDPWSGAGF